MICNSILLYIISFLQINLNILTKKSLRIAKELWEKREFTNEGSIEKRRSRYLERSSPVTRFLNDCCIKDRDAYCTINDFMLEFEEYCQDKKIQQVPRIADVGKILSQNFESRRVSTDGFKRTTYFGFALRSKATSCNN